MIRESSRPYPLHNKVINLFFMHFFNSICTEVIFFHCMKILVIEICENSFLSTSKIKILKHPLHFLK